MKESDSYCIWLVPPGSGRVRKYRVTSIFAWLAAAATGAALLAVLFLAGDYVRVRIEKAKERYAAEQLATDRDQLRNYNLSLSETLDSTKSSRQRIITFSRALEERLNALGAVIDADTGLGLFEDLLDEDLRGFAGDTYDLSERAHDRPDGVGGAEVDCPSADPQKCKLRGRFQAVSFDGRAMINPAQVQRLTGPEAQELEANFSLIAVLDRYIDTIQSIPLGSPATGHISSGFGFRRSPFSGKIRRHEGIDFSLSHGSLISSTGAGIVKAVRRTGTYGLMIDIAHSSRILTRYAHLSEVFVKEGQRVCREQAIALTGSTGRSTGPHLHYEVRVDGEAVDPGPFIRLAARLSEVSGF